MDVTRIDRYSYRVESAESGKKYTFSVITGTPVVTNFHTGKELIASGDMAQKVIRAIHDAGFPTDDPDVTPRA